MTTFMQWLREKFNHPAELKDEIDRVVTDYERMLLGRKEILYTIMRLEDENHVGDNIYCQAFSDCLKLLDGNKALTPKASVDNITPEDIKSIELLTDHTRK